MAKNVVPKIDKRIQKTKKVLSESLIALILEKGYEEISIQDILQKANVGRSTFYFHYENKDQLFLDGLSNLKVQIFDSTSDRKRISLLPLFQHISENSRLGKAILGKKSGDLFFDMLKHQIADLLAKNLKPRLSHQLEKKMWSYHCLAAASAVLSLTRSWLDDQLPFTPEQVSLQAEHYIKSILNL